MDLETRLEHLTEMVVASLHLWDVPAGATARVINVSENTTYLIEAAPTFKSILRVHRQGYHSTRAIECELAWLAALSTANVISVPKAVPGCDGALLQQAEHEIMPGPHHMVLFEFIEGTTPREDGDLVPGFEVLGALAAGCHSHALSWVRPTPFERLTWDADAVFGPNATWGNWRDAPGVTPERLKILEDVEATVTRRLEAYGKMPERFNLIHADMRLANLIESPSGMRLIDFDDCGFGWLTYDFAAAISFFEDDPRVPELKAAWLKGYRSVRPLSLEDEAEMETMVMLRRMALLAWIGSHIEAPEPQALAAHFAEGSAALGRAYLERHK